MPRKYVDFWIIPEGSSKKISFRLSFWKTRIILLVLGFWCVALIVLTLVYGRAVSDLILGESLREENERLKRYNARVVELEKELQEYRRFTGMVAELAGVEHPFPTDLQQTEANLASFQAEADLLGEADIHSTTEYAETEWITFQGHLSGAQWEAGVEPDSLRCIPRGQPIDGWVTRGFSPEKPLFGGEHPGVDFAAKEGTQVRVTADGTVSFAGWDEVYGNLAMVDHGNGYVTYYGHNSELLVDSNDFVKRGEVIALSGNSGRSSAPHLHYEIRKVENPAAGGDGVPVDPKDFLDLK
jgi:murein DD-endopeptidase MepM/ murein hydrolase activator NlpD